MKKQIALSVFLFLFLNIAMAQWQKTNGPDCANVTCLAISGNSLFAGTDSCGIFLSSDNGNSWNAAGTSPLNTYIWTILIKGNHIFAATNAGLFLSSDNGYSWAASGLSAQGVTSLASHGNKIFAGTGFGIYSSTDNDSNWVLANTSLSNTIITAMAAFGSYIYAGSEGKIFISSDNGSNWTTVTAGLPNYQVDVLSPDGSFLFAGFCCGRGIYLSTTYGKTWKAVNTGLQAGSVNDMVIRGNRIYEGSSYGGVCFTESNGMNWARPDTSFATSGVTSLAINDKNIFAGIYGNGVWIRPLSDFDGVFNNETSVTLYPNPANDRIIIELHGAYSSIKNSITITDILGQTMLQQPLTQERTEIYVNHFRKGIYFMKLENAEKTEITKFIKE